MLGPCQRYHEEREKKRMIIITDFIHVSLRASKPFRLSQHKCVMFREKLIFERHNEIPKCKWFSVRSLNIELQLNNNNDASISTYALESE